MREHPGSHFHLYCVNGHRTKAWAEDLDEELRSIVLSGHTVLASEQLS